MHTGLLSCALAWVALTGCSADDGLRRFTPADADARARSYLALFTEHRATRAETRLLPSLGGADAHAALAQLDSLLGGQRFDSVRIVGSAVNTMNGIRHTNLTYEIHSQMGWTLANVATVDSAGTWFVEGVSVRPIRQPLEAMNAFTLAGRSPKHYVWLVLTFACAAVSIGTAAWLGTRRAMPKRRRWMFLALVGVGAASLNWVTGEVTVRLIHIQLFAAAVLRPGPVAPWVLTFGIPVGALISLARYRRWRRTLAAPPDGASEGPGPNASPEAAG